MNTRLNQEVVKKKKQKTTENITRDVPRLNAKLYSTIGQREPELFIISIRLSSESRKIHRNLYAA